MTEDGSSSPTGSGKRVRHRDVWKQQIKENTDKTNSQIKHGFKVSQLTAARLICVVSPVTWMVASDCMYSKLETIHRSSLHAHLYAMQRDCHAVQLCNLQLANRWEGVCLCFNIRL